jgi:polar amino acid transport system substrate-binding protein
VKVKVALLLVGLTALAWSGDGLAQTLRVGVSGSPPFVMKDGSSLPGISVQIWADTAARLNKPYKFVRFPTTAANVDAVVNGQVDLAIGPISITPDRLANPKIDFTQPYFHGTEDLLLPLRSPGLFTRLRPFFGWAALSSAGGLMLLLFLVGNLIWLAERRRNAAQFPRRYLKGVGNGMWFALVTLTTVGYGDRAPLSKTGRAIAGIWMVVSLLVLSSITAGLASAFTVSLTRLDPSGIREKSDLRGRTSTLNEAIDLLSKEVVEAVIFDGAPLRYYLQQNPEAPYKMAPFSLANQTYGFVVPVDSPLRTPIDVVLLELQRKGEVKKITDSLLQ